MSELRIKKNKIKRKQQLKQYSIFTLSTIFFVFTLALTANVFFSNAKSYQDSSDTKCYTSILVEQGDTLWSIASEYKSYHYKDVEQYVNEVIHMNALMNEKIKAGQYLLIPYYEESITM